jgi:hypothetical protein
MPYWTVEQEKLLLDLINKGKPLEAVAMALNRSPEAVAMKLKRMGIVAPEKCRAKSVENKVTKNATTTTPLKGITPAPELISMKEMLAILLGALQRLQDPAISPLEIKRCRSIVSTAKSYVSMLKVYERMSELEQWLVNTQAKLLELTKRQLNDAKDQAEKEHLKQQIAEMEKFLEESALKYGYKPFQKKPSLMPEGGSQI